MYPLQHASIGIEKVLPRTEHLGVFVRMLSRSALGSPITQMTSHFRVPRPGTEMHIVLVDNGRADRLAMPDFWYSLKCIRCGACMNTCPVYRRSGGYSYGTTIPGPLGSMLAPHRDAAAHATLPFASTLCGSCDDVCPVRIDLHEQLLGWRREIGARGLLPWRKRAAMAVAARVLRHAWLYRLAGRAARGFLRAFPRLGRAGAWGRTRELPPMPRQSFRDLHRTRR